MNREVSRYWILGQTDADLKRLLWGPQPGVATLLRENSI